MFPATYAKLLVKCANIQLYFEHQIQLCLCTMLFLQTFIVTWFTSIKYLGKCAPPLHLQASYSLDYQSDIQVIPRRLWNKDLLPWAQLIAIGSYPEPKLSGLQLPTFLFQQ